MQKILETEVLGYLTADQFDEFKALFDQKMGGTKEVKRLAMQMTDFANRTLDTRIRITNGQAEIMQKLGDWDAKTRQEFSVALPSDPHVILQHWQVLDHLLTAPTAQKVIIQMESYTYDTPAYEIKLTHQTGKEDAYNFEVESLDAGCDLLEVCAGFGLEPATEPTDAAFWDAYNRRVNLQADDLTENEMLAIITRYCA